MSLDRILIICIIFFVICIIFQISQKKTELFLNKKLDWGVRTTFQRKSSPVSGYGGRVVGIKKKKKKDDTFYKNLKAMRISSYPDNLKSILIKHFGKRLGQPVANNRHIIFPKVIYIDTDNKYKFIKDILNQIPIKNPIPLPKGKQSSGVGLRKNIVNIDNLARQFVSRVLNVAKGGKFFVFGKVINPIIRSAITKDIIKYVVPIFVLDIRGVEDPLCTKKTIPLPTNMKKSTHAYLILAIFEFKKNDDEIFKTVQQSVVGVHLLGSIPLDSRFFTASNMYSNSIFDHTTHYSWFWKHDIAPKKDAISQILARKEKDKFILTNWTNGKAWCKAFKLAEHLAWSKTPEGKAAIAKKQKEEEEKKINEEKQKAAKLAKKKAEEQAKEEKEAVRIAEEKAKQKAIQDAIKKKEEGRARWRAKVKAQKEAATKKLYARLKAIENAKKAKQAAAAKVKAAAAKAKADELAKIIAYKTKNFDAQCYLDKYKDLKGAFGTNHVKARQHWDKYGIKEKRDPTCSAEVLKKRSKQKAREARIKAWKDKLAKQAAARKAKEAGIAKKRLAKIIAYKTKNFDCLCYLNRYKDLKGAFGADCDKAKKHWLSHGIKENRDPTCSSPEERKRLAVIAKKAAVEAAKAAAAAAKAAAIAAKAAAIAAEAARKKAAAEAAKRKAAAEAARKKAEYDAAGLYSFETFTFTNCGKNGTTGPTLSQCRSTYSPAWTKNNSYLNMSINVSSGIQLWTVPRTARYIIDAYGAQGGDNSKSQGKYGKGQRIKARFSLTKGDKYMILVGQMGTKSNHQHLGSGGGGGTFIVKGTNYTTSNTSDVLLVAGGGGGAGGSGWGRTAHAVSSSNVSSTSGGNKGAYGSGGGGGFSGNGQMGTMSFKNGAKGGDSGPKSVQHYGGGNSYGGFGGGGGAYVHPGAGGGGYRGGDGGTSGHIDAGFGGYSRNNGDAVGTAGYNNGQGKVIITFLG